jgi:hypothetical protein
MLYFIQKDTMHQYPVAKECKAVYEREQLRDTVLRGVKQCPYCMNDWPGKDD